MRRMKKIAVSILATVFGVGMLVALPTAAWAGTVCTGDPRTGYTCTVDDSGGGSPGGGGPIDGVNFTPGPTECIHKGTGDEEDQVVPCSSNGRDYWSNDRQCYWSLDDPQSAPPPGRVEGQGAWYSCLVGALCTDPRGCYGSGQWLLDPPPGVVAISPAQAANAVAQRLGIQPFEIGMAPQVNPEWGHRRSYVGVPVWLWVNNPGPSTWGPFGVSETVGPVSVTGSVQVTSVVWNMGDGTSKACVGTGTPYATSYGVADSPTCGHRYTRTSSSQPGDRYTVTATAQWSFTWTAGGQSGTIPLTTTSTSQLEINELQSVNVPNPNG